MQVHNWWFFNASCMNRWFYGCHLLINLSLINAYFENFPLSINVFFNWVCIHGMMTWEIFSVHLICIKHFVAIYFHAHSSPCMKFLIMCSFLVSFLCCSQMTWNMFFMLLLLCSILIWMNTKVQKERVRDEKEKGQEKWQ